MQHRVMVSIADVAQSEDARLTEAFLFGRAFRAVAAPDVPAGVPVP
jgi:hypothetical protein